MKILALMSDWMIPAVFLWIILYARLKKVKVMESFVVGVNEGFQVVVDILPTFLGLMVAVGALRASGTLDLLARLLTPVSRMIWMPEPLLPVALTKVVSSSAATGLILDILKTFGPDSLEGRMAGVMVGSTETILYTMSVYFMAIRVKDTRYTLSGALISNLAGIGASIFLTYWIFY
ncbi:MAG: spore maturation protein [Lachnospiraceae bacterium]|jgi:spore maturation protein B|nr:spore maturation protein [Lachnospiraceae bacterium]